MSYLSLLGQSLSRLPFHPLICNFLFNNWIISLVLIYKTYNTWGLKLIVYDTNEYKRKKTVEKNIHL